MKNIFNRIKKKWVNYLTRLAETNKKIYGDKRLDCCQLNGHKYAKYHGNKSQ